MTRRAARITHDEVVRMLKAAKSAGLSIRNFSFDGGRVTFEVNNGDSGDDAVAPLAATHTFQSLEEYEAWRMKDHAGGH